MNKVSYTHVHIKNVKTFDDLYDVTSKLKPKEKGDLFELITFYTFKLSPLLNNRLQNIWLYNDIPIKVKRDLKLPEKDKGIDLLALIDDEYYAIQSKFRQNKNSVVSWGDLSTFFGLSFGINNKIKGGFLVTNTYDLCDEVINSDKIEPIYGDFFDNLPNNFFDNIVKSVEKQKIVGYIRKTPLKHQLECINKCDEYFKNHNRGYIEMACGSGKTLTSYWIDKKMGNKLTLVLVPSLYLLSQFYQDWVSQSYSENIKVNYILVGSDADVSEEIKYKSNGLILEMNSDNIKQLIEKHKNEKTVIISTYQSSDKLFNTTDCFDMCVFDESHKTVGQVGKQFSLMIKDSDCERIDEIDEEDEDTSSSEFDDEKIGSGLNGEIQENEPNENSEREIDEDNVDENTNGETEENNLDGKLEIEKQNIKINKRLFMTATPKNYVGSLDDEQIISMDNEKYYGKEIFSYNTGKAIEDRRLVDYQLLTMVAQNKEIQQSISSNKLVKYKKMLDGEESNYLAIVLIILKKMHDGTCNHMVTYHNAIKRSKKFADLLIKVNKELYKEDIFIESLDGSISMAKRNRIIKEYVAGRKGIICSARVLCEGINIPIIDSVCFVDNRSSTIDIVQCIGRSLRLHRSKKMANIIVPIFIGNLDDIVENSAFGGIVSILKALKSTDEGVTEYFIVNENGKAVSKRNILKYEVYGKVTKDIEIDLAKWGGKLETVVWKIVDPFESMYEKVKAWINSNERLPSPHSKNQKEKQFGQWCANKKNDKKKNKLDEDKIKKLEELDNWHWSEDTTREVESFDKMYEKVKKWVDCNKRLPSHGGKNQKEKQLGQWCRNKRKYYKKNKLEEEKIKKLEKLDMWFWNLGDLFDGTYEELRIWINSNKRLPSSGSKNQKEKQLGRWCSDKRKYYKKNKLEEEKIKKLEGLDMWYWGEDSIKEVKTFDETYEKLKIWISNNKRIPLGTSKNFEEKQFSSWCSHKRYDKKNGKLDEYKIKKLEELKGWYWRKTIVAKENKKSD